MDLHDLPYTCHLIPLSSWAVIAHLTGMNHDKNEPISWAQAPSFPQMAGLISAAEMMLKAAAGLSHGKMVGLKGRSLEHMGTYGEIIGRNMGKYGEIIETYGNIWENLWNI